MKAIVTTKAALLLALLEDGESYGLELIDRAELSQGSAYPTLHQMAEDGLISVRLGDEARQGRPRKYYKLTTTGRREARQIKRSIESLAD